MNNNEQYMKTRGEKRIWKSVSVTGKTKKKVSSTQIGQQLLLDETLRIFHQVKDWIENKSARAIRSDLKAYFSDDEILEKSILETMLLLSGDVEATGWKNSSVQNYRHKKVTTIQKRIMPELSFDNTWRFIEVVVDYSTYFKIEKVLHKKANNFKWNIKYVCTLSKVILAKLSMEAAEAFYPLVMTEKPVAWKYDPFEKTLVGGYKDFQYDMIRFNGKDIDYRLYSQEIFDVCNLIQGVPWKINKEVLVQLKKDVKIPLKSQYILMEYPDVKSGKWEINLEEESLSLTDVEIEALKKHRLKLQEQIRLYNAEKSDYDSAVGKYQAIKLAIEIATKYQDEEEIYFPHSYDFRGRIYPLSVGISPQGSDEVKALLLYKNVEPLTEIGIKWNWAYLASLYGDDKLPFNERVERGQDLIDADYLEADEPYQFLSHQIELNKWICNQSYIPNTRIHLDACNSGSQFTSAITGDKFGCESTNVFPTYDEDGKIDRKDAYLLVAQKAISITKDLIKAESDEEQLDVLAFLLQLLKDHGRKLCKRPTMVSNYGGTAAGRESMLWDMFRELGCPHKYITKKNSTLLAQITGNAIKGVLTGGKAFESYVQKMTMLIAKNNAPIEWRTSDGFHVIHKKNKELKPTKVTCMLPGARRSTVIKKNNYSKELSPYKMRSAISPNYIHSLDAELLRRTALKMREAGIADADYIHDSFGCHPNHVETLLNITKREFIEMMRKDPLSELDYDLRAQVSNDDNSQKKLKKVLIPHLNGFDIKGEELNRCYDSDWFFS
tara:strand:+ start:573 stop:2909 length:2337 start_codon:yes stop_codon:yes gene_type:complete